MRGGGRAVPGPRPCLRVGARRVKALRALREGLAEEGEDALGPGVAEMQVVLVEEATLGAENREVAVRRSEEGVEVEDGAARRGGLADDVIYSLAQRAI